MQNVGIYHNEAQLCSQPNSAVVFPGALPLDPADSPQTPIYSRYALGCLSADFMNNVDPL